jgi:hypothetical protein
LDGCTASSPKRRRFGVPLRPAVAPQTPPANVIVMEPRRIGAVLAIGLATAITACLGPLIPGECSDEERAAFEGIEHYGAVSLVAEDYAQGGCRGTFESEEDPQVVLQHYDRAFEAAGWLVERRFEGPVRDENGNRIGTSFDLAALKGPIGAEVSGTDVDGQPTLWVVLVYAREGA